MIIKYVNNVTHKEYKASVNDIGDSRLYFHFLLTVPEGVDDGEYSCYLFDENEENCFWTGLIQVGDYKQTNKKYDNKKEIKQYNG